MTLGAAWPMATARSVGLRLAPWVGFGSPRNQRRIALNGDARGDLAIFLARAMRGPGHLSGFHPAEYQNKFNE
jgi:hypothetical protein